MAFFSRERETIAPQAPTITQLDLLTPEQQALLGQTTGTASDILAGGGRTDPFTGELSAGPSALQQQAFGSVSDLFGEGGQAQQFIGRGFDPFSQQATIDQFNQFQRPFAESNRAISEDLLLNRLSAAGGFTSGATSRALARAGTEFDLGLQSQLGTQLNIDRSRSDIQNQQALQNLFGIQGQGLGAGGIQQGIEQSALDRQRQEFVRQQQIDPLLQQLLGPSLGTQQFENIVQFPQTTFGPSPASQTSSLLGGVGRLAGGLSGFF